MIFCLYLELQEIYNKWVGGGILRFALSFRQIYTTIRLGELDFQNFLKGKRAIRETANSLVFPCS